MCVCVWGGGGGGGGGGGRRWGMKQKRSKFYLGPSIHRLVTDIKVNVYIGNTLSRRSFQN